MKCSDLVTNVLEDERDLRKPNFGSKEVIMIILQFHVSVMVPPVQMNDS